VPPGRRRSIGAILVIGPVSTAITTASRANDGVTLRARLHRFVERHEVAWELGFGLLALVFVAMAFVEPSDPGVEAGIVVVEWAITAVFAVEFFGRLWAAPHRAVHLRAHLVDLISVIPPARWLRPFRLLRLLRLVRTFAGVSRALAQLPRLANHRGLVWLVAAWLAVTLLASTGMYIAEHGVNAAFDEPLDALWWGVVTLSTVGYGDVYPVTPEGRVAAMALMVLGIGLYSAITAAVTSYFVSRDSAGGSITDQLARLEVMRDRRSLTEDEHRAAKAKLLDMAP